MEPIPLFDSYFFREATPQEFGPFFFENRPKVFNEDITINVEDWMTNQEKQMRTALRGLIHERYQVRFFILKDQDIIGWHLGRQIDEEQFYMGNTGIFKEHRNKGKYKALLPELLKIYKEKGFQKVVSKHLASNNAVIVPKLKAGFVITGFEIDERFGLELVLSYIFNERRLNAYQFRTGFLRLDDDLKKYL